MLVKNNVLNEINKEEHTLKVLRTAGKIKRKVSQNLDDLKLADKVS